MTKCVYRPLPVDHKAERRPPRFPHNTSPISGRITLYNGVAQNELQSSDLDLVEIYE